MSLRSLQSELKRLTNPTKAAFLQRFFKTGPGEYAAGDRFRGITVPELRALAKAHRSLSFDDAAALLASEWHEDRLAALYLLIDQHKRGDAAAQRRIHRLYLGRIATCVNNWDLVDSSAAALVGGHIDLHGLDASLLDKLARDKNLWRRRVGMVATFHFIRKGSFGHTLRIAEALLGDREDLLHKASGWMLREMGKKDPAPLLAFLERHAAVMPRTMLRYAIERLPEAERREWMGKGMATKDRKDRKGQKN